jgi:HSP20 family protein
VKDNFKQYGSGNFEEFRTVSRMNEHLRNMFGPEFFQNILKNMPWNDFSQLESLSWQNLMQNSPTGKQAQIPRIDIYQTRQEVVAVIELPGLESESDINISVKPDSLTVSGSLEGRYGNITPERFHLSERFRGNFERTVNLPARVRPQQARATYLNGILEIRMIKTGKGNSSGRGTNVPITFT